MSLDAEQLISKANDEGDFITEVDGFVYYSTGKGHLSEWMLRSLADELARRNEKWQASIDDYFEKMESPT